MRLLKGNILTTIAPLFGEEIEYYGTRTYVDIRTQYFNFFFEKVAVFNHILP